MPLKYRRCRGCKLMRTERAFDANSRTKDGLSRDCRSCGTKGAVAKRELARAEKRCKSGGKYKIARYFPNDSRTMDGKIKTCLACQ